MRILNPFRATRVDLADSMVLTAIFLAAAYWGLEALINLFSPAEISFYRRSSGRMSATWACASSCCACF